MKPLVAFTSIIVVSLFALPVLFMSQIEDAYKQHQAEDAYKQHQAEDGDTPQQQLTGNLYIEDVTCLADTVYFEARSENILGQLAVAQVVMNRVFSSNGLDTVCDVVYKGKMSKSGRMIKNKCQFSFYCDGKPERIHDIEGYNQSSLVATLAMSGVYIEGLQEATSFHAVGKKPKWVKSKEFLRRVDNHMFYKD